MRSRNSPNWFGFVFLPSSQSWRNSGEKLTGLESRNDLMNNCSRSEVRLIHPERFGENHVTNNGIWIVSSCVGESLGAANAHRVGCTAHKTEVHHESNVGPAWSNSALHKMLIGCRITFVRLLTKELADADVPIVLLTLY